MELTSLEICAGAGGQALGLHMAGFQHVALVEVDEQACATLRLNHSNWNIIETDLHQFDARPYKGVDLLAGGIPCPPFSVAGKQLGMFDERDLFPQALHLVDEIKPKAIMFENVKGLLGAKFQEYRSYITRTLQKMNYVAHWNLLHSSNYGVSQLRPRAILIALQKQYFDHFHWPEPVLYQPPTVGELLYDLMAENGWQGVKNWKEMANSIAPTLVGGSKKHGGADLGPTRAKQAWAKLGIDGKGLWDEAPSRDFSGIPRLTTRMTARIQGFPDYWLFAGRKTSVYRQIGNAFPPPVAQALGKQIYFALLRKSYKVAA